MYARHVMLIILYHTKRTF